MAKQKPATRDKFGLKKGTNTAKAASMFRQGATMADVKTKTGSNQYNVLSWLKKQGHQIIKDKETGMITVVPKPESV